MSRKHRKCMPETTYHVTSRCIERKLLMKSEEFKKLMIEVLNLALEKYDFELIAYTIMDNHFHFCIKTTKHGHTISRIMQFIKSQFARRYNRIMKRIGPFWNERFSDTIIEMQNDPIAYFITILLYFAYNSVRSNIVRDPRNFQFSSFRCYVDKNYISPVNITLHEYFIKLGSTFEERVKKLLVYEEMYRRRIFPGNIYL